MSNVLELDEHGMPIPYTPDKHIPRIGKAEKDKSLTRQYEVGHGTKGFSSAPIIESFQRKEPLAKHSKKKGTLQFRNRCGFVADSQA